MDKRNYTLREIEIQALKENCSLMKSKLINELENRVLKRKRVLKKPGTVDNGNLLVYYRENSESGAGSGGMGF